MLQIGEKKAHSRDLRRRNLVALRSDEPVTVVFKPLSGILGKMICLPLRYLPLTLELSLVGH